ncbi:hypothetical protein RA27_16935 [Ruegeria sp. ANG-R]|nr:hypothetical protein RA27_16935 [Ruegeria sp. ANG-R]
MFTGISVAIPVLFVLELVLIILIGDFGLGNFVSTRFPFLSIGVQLVRPFIEDYAEFTLVAFVGAFAIAAHAEGRNYFKRNTNSPISVNMLSGSLAMALIGLGVLLGMLLLIDFLVLGGATFFQSWNGFWDSFYCVAALVTATLLCRISFGVGLRAAKQRLPIISGEPS